MNIRDRCSFPMHVRTNIQSKDPPRIFVSIYIFLAISHLPSFVSNRFLIKGFHKHPAILLRYLTLTVMTFIRFNGFNLTSKAGKLKTSA